MPLPSALLGLLADCKAHPDEDAPRLILADWIEDNGDPERAEFLRLQVAESGSGPRPLSLPRRRALGDRDQALLAQHGGRWLGPLAALGRGAVGWSRGLLALTL